jgi:hypothetical protein
MKKGDFFFILVVLLVVLALVLLVVNINSLFPTPEPYAFAQSLAPVQSP